MFPGLKDLLKCFNARGVKYLLAAGRMRDLADVEEIRESDSRND
jgi:hypothetical protein